MEAAMGMFFILLSVLKLFDVKGFARGFAGYDIVAERFPPYGLAYPFIELALGLLYLSGAFSFFTNAVTLVLMLTGSLGVIRALRRGETVRCVCVGAGFNLPVGRVTLAENLIMAAMAAAHLV